MNDLVKSPSHYTTQVDGIECWDIAQHMPGNLAHAFTYMWRYKDKGNPIQDLQKAIAWVEHEQNRLDCWGIDNHGKSCFIDQYSIDADEFYTIVSHFCISCGPEIGRAFFNLLSYLSGHIWEDRGACLGLVVECLVGAIKEEKDEK